MNRPYTLAHPWHRFAAYLIDALVLFLLSGIVSSFFASMGEDGKMTIAPISLLFVFLLNMAYYTGFLAGSWQTTPGGRLMRIYTIRADRQRITQRDALERFLALILPSLPLYASFLPANIAPMLVIWLHIFWFTPILTHPERTGIHDKITRMRVVEGQPNP